MTQLAKKYMRLAAKWPIDKNKNEARNYRYFLEKQINWICGLSDEPMTPHRDDKPLPTSNEFTMRYHDANLKAIQELTNNEHQKRWPTDHYVTGTFGLNLEQLRQANTERGREVAGITSSFWKSIKVRFWRPS